MRESQNCKEKIMLDEMVLEKRLVTLEQTVSDLQKKVSSKPTGENWLEKLTGSISDEEVFLEALEYGRSFRQSDDENKE
jgi:glycine cleavage system H lipoate-binding protein